MIDNFPLRELVIQKDKAVFWMDARGRWQNQYGPFEHPKIIAYFNSSIRKDQDGYFVEQIRDGLREKVYFKYEETPLFVIDISARQPVGLTLNTGRCITLEPDRLFIRNDQLYIRFGDQFAKFSERSLIRFADWLDYQDDRVFFRNGNEKTEIQRE